jgi:hypothetical protein
MLQSGILTAPAFSGAGLIGRWSPGIGDPSLGGWLTVVAYAGAALLCLHVLGSRQHVPATERTIWRVLSGSLVLLGINKQLDLQTALTEAGRITFRAFGWFAYKAYAQLAFIIMVALGAGLSATWLLRRARETPVPTRVAVLGFALVLSFVGIRAASFHHIDRFIGIQVGGARMNWILELGGLTVLGVAAARRVRPGPAPKAR